MTTKYVTKTEAIEVLLTGGFVNPEVAVETAEKGFSVYGDGYSVSRQPGRYNGQDYVVRIYREDES